MKTLLLLIRITIAIILLQTLAFKFTAHPDSVYLFTKIHMEPYGRVGVGILELIASILLLIPATIIYGAIMATALMAGAVFFHLTILGIAVNGDSRLFFLALVTLLLSLLISYKHRREIPFI
jgi:putative oxidoreductase